MTTRDDIGPSEVGAWAKVKDSTKRVTDYDAHAAQSSEAAVAPLGTPENPSSAILTVANLITAGRFVLTAVFLWLFVTHDNRYVSLALYAIASVTDFLDGWVARSTQTVSWLGKIMDPIMDRFLLFTGVIGLVARGELPLWVAVFVVGRDLILAGGSLYLQRFRRRPLDVSYIGKAATALLMTGFCLMLLGQPAMRGLGLVEAPWLPGLNAQDTCVGILVVYAGLACSAVTAILYYVRGLRIRREVQELKRTGR